MISPQLGPLQFFERLINSTLDVVDDDPHLSRRKAVLDIALIVGTVTSVVLGTFYIWISTFLALFHFFTAGIFLALLAVHRKSHATTICGQIACAYLFVFLAITIWHLGALYNASMGWFVVIPISAAIIVGTGAAWFWILITSLTAVGFFVANQFGVQPVSIIDPALRPFAYLCFFVALMLVIGVLISTWLASQRVLEAQLNKSLNETENEALNAQVLASTSTAANEGAAFDATAQDCMDILCNALGWEAAHLWIRNDDGTMMPTSIVSSDIDPAFAPLIPGADETFGGRESYFPQVVARTRNEIIQPDLDGDARNRAGENLGLGAVLVWPVVIDGVVDAVLEFFSRRPTVLDTRARQQLHHVALQLAHVRGREVARGRIEQLAYYDIVTGLPNRHAFERRFGAILDAAARRKTRIALMFIDLDGFKHVNDSLGHTIGDRLLHTIGNKLSDNLRGSDFALKFSASGAPMVARLGGDEFTVVLQDLQDLRGADVVARRFLDIISKPIDIGGREVVVGASIGISVYPDDATNRSDLLRLADAAMYEAKRTAGNQYRFATQALNTNVQRRVWLESELRRALAADTIAPHFQPIVDSRSGEIVAYEALARWQHEGNWIEPIEFIQLAEETGMIHGLGEMILRRACAAIVQLNNASEQPQRVCVNVSPHQLRHDQFVPGLSQVLADTRCEAQWLVLELTESSLIIDDEMSIQLLQNLREMGIGIALDDFGTGFASLSYLRTFPLDYVKIDRSFIADLNDSDEDCAIVAAIATMSHTLQLQVIAEGIETESQANRVRSLGCDALQGFLIGEPAAFV